MSTEFYVLGGVGSAGGDYDMRKYLGARVGLGNGTVGFSWDMHPEQGIRRVAEAGGASDAYGRYYTVRDFERMLRRCVRQDWTHCSLLLDAQHGTLTL